jgi:hypothetical protein
MVATLPTRPGPFAETDRGARGVRRTDRRSLGGNPVKTIIILAVVVLLVLFLLGTFRPGGRRL